MGRIGGIKKTRDRGRKEERGKGGGRRWCRRRQGEAGEVVGGFGEKRGKTDEARCWAGVKNI